MQDLQPAWATADLSRLGQLQIATRAGGLRPGDVLDVVGDELGHGLGLGALDDALGHPPPEPVLDRGQDGCVGGLDPVRALGRGPEPLIQVWTDDAIGSGRGERVAGAAVDLEQLESLLVARRHRSFGGGLARSLLGERPERQRDQADDREDAEDDEGPLAHSLPPTLDGAGGAEILTAPMPAPVGAARKAGAAARDAACRRGRVRATRTRRALDVLTLLDGLPGGPAGLRAEALRLEEAPSTSALLDAEPA